MRVLTRFLVPLLCALSASAAVVPSTTYFGEHATDAVHWLRWEKAAFDRAAREQKPIALAIGSFAPHCVRMEHIAINSDPAVFDTLNASFIPILLDRAEFPLIARAYAAASGPTDGNDLVIYAITPDLELLERVDISAQALQRVARRWNTERDAYLAEVRVPVRRLRANLPVAATPDPMRPDYAALDGLVRSRDDRERAAKALHALDRSALHDILGGGFHRAARDEAWTDPYFDKTLDDQAAAASLCLDAWKLLASDRYREVARTTLEYGTRDLQLTNGSFNASQHADSVVPLGKAVTLEGAYYMWEQSEIVHIFGDALGARLSERFGVLPQGNIAEFPGRNILRAARVDAPEPAVANAIAKLLDIRLKRPMPLRDDAIAESSGRMIAQLARGGMMLDDTRYVHAALTGMAAIQRSLFDAKTKLLVRRPGVPATRADYDAVIDAAIETYEATLDPKLLDFALRLQEQSKRADDLRAVPEPVRDFVTVSAPSEYNATRLAAITGRAESALTRVIIFGRPYRPETQLLLKAAYQADDHDRVVIFGGEAKKPAPANIAIGSLQPNPDGTSSAYICRPAGCSDAFTEPLTFAAALQSRR